MAGGLLPKEPRLDFDVPDEDEVLTMDSAIKASCWQIRSHLAWLELKLFNILDESGELTARCHSSNKGAAMLR